MPIPNNLKTPNIYTNVNINTQRTGLPTNVHKVLFLTPDENVDEVMTPVEIYDKADADKKFGDGSVMGRMVTAAIKTYRTVNVAGAALGES